MENKRYRIGQADNSSKSKMAHCCPGHFIEFVYLTIGESVLL